MIILGIDPGTLKTGFGIIKVEGNKCSLIEYGVIKTCSKTNLIHRLHKIFDAIKEISSKWNPEIVSIENIFIKDNPRSAILLGHARGAAICAAKFGSLLPPLFLEYTPREIKLGITGDGKASKEQLAFMVKVILNIKNMKIPEDASDALGTAIFAANNIGYRNKIKQSVL